MSLANDSIRLPDDWLLLARDSKQRWLVGATGANAPPGDPRLTAGYIVLLGADA